MIDTTLFGLEELLKQLYWVHIDDDLDDAKRLIPAIRYHHEWADFDLSDFHCFLSSLLATAVARSSRSWITFLLDDGVDITEDVIFQALCPHLSVENSCFTLRLLREKGWDVNSKSSDGVPFLHHAVTRSSELVDWFMDAGADVNSTNDNTGDSALDVAANKGDLATLSTLQRHGAHSASGAALQLAAVRPESDAVVLPILTFLIRRYRFDINHINESVDTPLHAAIWSRSVARARLLLQHGANPTIVGVIRGSPTLYARDIDHPEMESLLRDWSAPPAVDREEWIMVEEECIVLGTDSEDEFESYMIPALKDFAGLSIRT